MNTRDVNTQDTRNADEEAAQALYRQTLDGWNAHDSEACARPFAEECAIIGFDGSQHAGRAGYAADLRRIFADHVTAAYVAKVRSVRMVAPDVAILVAVAGMVPPGQKDINPAVNAVQTVVAARRDGEWRIVHFQTTPAQYHGRPEMVQQLTDELRQAAGN